MVAVAGGPEEGVLSTAIAEVAGAEAVAAAWARTEAAAMALTHPVVARPPVALVTTHWGDGNEEAVATTRLLAGALARHARVEVVHLNGPPVGHGEPHGAGAGTPPAGGPVADSIFPVHPVHLTGARPLVAGVVQAALAEAGAATAPAAARGVLRRLEGHAPALGRLLREIGPVAVLLAGHRQPLDPGDLGGRGEPGAPRVVALPCTASPALLAASPLAELLERADVVAYLHPGERDALAALGHDRLVPLELALPLNRRAVEHPLFGIRFFAPYVLLLRSFPAGGGRFRRSLTHELAIRTLRISAAEVDGDRWRVSDAEGTLPLPVTPTRINLWRLMAHAEMTIDLRPPGPLGREALESMLLGTPVVVPEGSAAMAHARAAGGGLWYRDHGELLDAARALLDPALRARLGAQGAAYAAAHHGRIDDFVDRVGPLVLGAA